jgi:ketosteroid isomerase-like protein
MGLSLEERITRLEDIEAIKSMITTYARGADRNNDPELLAPLYTEDAVWEAEGFGRHEGIAAISREMAKVGRETILWSLHYMISPDIRVADDGRSAECFWYLWELAKMPGENGEPEDSVIGGWYETELVKTDAGWKFKHVKLNLKLICPVHESWKTLP